MINKTILVTGGLGFVGSSLARYYVNEKYNVTILTKTLDKINNIKDIKEDVDIIQQDICEVGEYVNKFDYIIHCASTVHNYHILSDPHIDIKTNCIGTINLLEHLKNSKQLKKMVYVSTFFVNNGEPKALYGATKLCAEHICKSYNSVFNVPVTIVRLSNVFGPGEQCDNNKKAAFNRMIQLALDNEEIKLYDNGKIKRDYIYIDDVVQGIDTVMNKGKHSEVYEIGKGYSLTLKEMIGDIIYLAGGGKIIPVCPPEFHTQVGINDYFCDTSKMFSLGWKPKVSVKDGIRKTIEVYKNG